MFIQDDEFILLMEDQDGGRYTVDDLKRLRDVGVQTVVRYPCWSDIEPEQGKYVWDSVDEKVAITREAGLKCMLAVYDKVPIYFPDDWYLKYHDGNIYSGSFYDHVISPWSIGGWVYHLDFIKKFCDRYSADDVLCFRATVHGGETILPEYRPYRQDGSLLETLERMVLDEQRIFYETQASRELWTCLHHAFDSKTYSGTQNSEHLYQKMHDAFPDMKHYCISYTQFRDDVLGEDENRAEMQRLGLSMFAGSEYCEGLITNTDKAIEQGFRGFVTSPLHGLGKHRVLEPWMLDAIKESLSKWRQARVH
jgi:hypothetical protein